VSPKDKKEETEGPTTTIKKRNKSLENVTERPNKILAIREKSLSPENSPTGVKDRSPILKGRNSPTKRNAGEEDGDAGSDTEKNHQEKAKYNSLLSLSKLRSKSFGH